MEINSGQYSQDATSVDIPTEDYSSWVNLKKI